MKCWQSSRPRCWLPSAWGILTWLTSWVFLVSFIFVQLCLAIQASNYGFGLVSVEESELTADFLLSKPVSRVQVITSKLLAALTSLAITDLVVWVASIASFYLFGKGRQYDSSTLLLLLLSLVVFQLFFLGVGLFISLLVKKGSQCHPLRSAWLLEPIF